MDENFRKREGKSFHTFRNANGPSDYQRELNEGKKPSLSELEKNGNITKKQVEAYNDYFKKHPTESRNVS